ncbi:unnamed protein product [Rhizophagus irregularis]|nr:unnamed protein product [Rhizophagus irregularis]
MKAQKAIENNFITYYDYNEFKNKKKIENSNNSVGKIFKANWNNTNTNLVVKTLYELDVKKIVNELKAQKEVNFHKNILQIYGISKLDNQYSLLLEYADGGSLYSYLKKSFTKLEWDDKYCLASQLANAIDFIHSKGIIHCNLHEENDTPVEYSDIYTACWSDDPDERPSIQIVVSCLKSIIDHSIKSITNEIENNDLKYMMDDYDLSIYDNFSKIMIDDNSSLNTFDYVKNKLLILNLTNLTDNVEKIVDKLIDHLIRIHDELYKDEDKAIRLFSKASKDNYPIAQFYLGIEKDYDKSIEWFEKSASQGYIITQLLLGILYEKLKKDFENSFCWIERAMKRARKFKKSHISAHYDNLLSAQKDDFKLFELYERSAEQGCYSAIYILGHLYINGIGFGKKLKESVHLIEKAAKKGNKYAQLYLAKFYEEGIIVEKSRVEAFKWYKNAANDGNKYAQVILGLYFEKGGYGFVKKDIKKAVWWYEKSAEQDYAYAQCCLGYLYEKGEEIDRDSRKAIYWYKKAAENGYDAAYYLLAKFYEVVEKNEAKAFKCIKYYIEKGYFKGMYVLIGYYKRGIGTDIDREKADNLLKIATKIRKLKKTDAIS